MVDILKHLLFRIALARRTLLHIRNYTIALPEHNRIWRTDRFCLFEEGILRDFPSIFCLQYGFLQHQDPAMDHFFCTN